MEQKRPFVRTRRQQPWRGASGSGGSRGRPSLPAGSGQHGWRPRLGEAKGQGHGFEEARRGWFAPPRDGEAGGDSCLEKPGAHRPLAGAGARTAVIVPELRGR